MNQFIKTLAKVLSVFGIWFFGGIIIFFICGEPGLYGYIEATLALAGIILFLAVTLGIS